MLTTVGSGSRPGLPGSKLTKELKKKGFRVIMPLTPPAERSVLTDFMEREEPTNQVYDYGEPLQAMEVVWPTGEIFRMGSASVNGYPDSPSKGGNPSGPGLDFYRFFQCAQGTMGVVTWTNLKMESIPKMDKILFAPIDDLDYAMDFLHRILPRRIGQEVLLLNNVDLAAILAEEWPGDFDKLKATLPPWTLILVISGLLRRPEEKIAYEENFLAEVIRNEFPDLRLGENLPGFPGLRNKLLPILRNPWPADVPHWKNRVKGACQSLFFHTRPLQGAVFRRPRSKRSRRSTAIPAAISAYISSRLNTTERADRSSPSSTIPQNRSREGNHSCALQRGCHGASQGRGCVYQALR